MRPWLTSAPGTVALPNARRSSTCGGGRAGGGRGALVVGAGWVDGRAGMGTHTTGAGTPPAPPTLPPQTHARTHLVPRLAPLKLLAAQLVHAGPCEGGLDERGLGQEGEGARHARLVDKQPAKHDGHQDHSGADRKRSLGGGRHRAHRQPQRLCVGGGGAERWEGGRVGWWAGGGRLPVNSRARSCPRPAPPAAPGRRSSRA